MRNILVIAPHADDEVLGCGGTIARAVAEGVHVEVLVVTKDAPHVLDTALWQQIHREAHSVHRQLGVSKTSFLDFPAPLLDRVAGHEVSDAIGRQILEQRPDTVFIPHEGDIHYDHTATYRTALVACRPINNSSIRQVLAYETLSESEWAPPRGDTWFIPNVYIDITSFIDVKVRAMVGYGSQIRDEPHPRSVKGIIALAKFRGFTVGVSAAEAFAMVRLVG
jgi:N-acetylglucosamine malate deacetylase 1